MTKLSTFDSINLYNRLSIADEKKYLLNIIMATESYISLLELSSILEHLKKGEELTIDDNILFIINQNLDILEKTKTSDITVTVTGFGCIEDANEFCSWYENQGESDSSIWFDCRVSEGIIDTTFMGTNYISQSDKNHIYMDLNMYT